MSIVTVKDAEWLLGNRIRMVQWWTIWWSIRPILLSAYHFLLFTATLFISHSFALFYLIQVCKVVLLFLNICQLVFVNSFLLTVRNLIYNTFLLLSKVSILDSTLSSTRVVGDGGLWSHNFLVLILISSSISGKFWLYIILRLSSFTLRLDMYNTLIICILVVFFHS